MPLIHFLGEQFGNLKLCTDTKERHKCTKGELCWDSPTHVHSSLNGSLGALLRNQLTHPMSSTSSREYLVTDHWVSVPIYLHHLGRLHGRRCRWAELWNVLEREGPELWTQILSGLTSGQALHLADLSVFICKTQTPMAANSWVCVRLKHDVCEALSSAQHIVKVKSLATVVRHHHHFILGTKRTWTIWICSGNSIHFQCCLKRTLSTNPKLPPPLPTPIHTYLRTGFPRFCVYRVRAVLGGYQQ